MKSTLRHIVYAVLGVVVLQAAVHMAFSQDPEPEADTSISERSIRCAIEIDRSKWHYPGLTVGYNYYLLEECAKALGDTLIGTVHSLKGESYIDSLRLGKVDIVVLGYHESADLDSVLLTHPIDSTTVWAIREDRVRGLEEINAWIDALPETEGFEDTRNSFLNRYSPAKRAAWGRTSTGICPYDEILRSGAGRIGWDWRMLAALVYAESKFHIESVSPAGAQGLMQMMPATARRYGVTNLFDPEQSISAGVEFLHRLQRMFSSQAVNDEELKKFVFAAYNAGEGRLRDIVNYANSIGADSGTWDGLVSVIPDMRDSVRVQSDSTIKLGTFQGHETIAYVKEVLSLYDNFKAICPKP